ncbi:MAG: efflux transporter outer membrane subunit [Halothiobacillus sp.]
MNPLNRIVSNQLNYLVLFVSLTLLAGCTLGPVGAPPTLPADAGYTAAPVVLSPESGLRLSANTAPVAQWWQQLDSPQLDGLIAQALQHNPDLAAQQAALKAAQEYAAAGQSTLFPSVQAGFSPSRQKVAREISSTLSSGSNLFNLHTAQVQITYPLDVFGGNRRQVEAGQALAAQQAALVDAARITLINNVILGAVQYAALVDAAKCTEMLVALNQTALDRTRRQIALGQLSASSALVAQTALAQTQSTQVALHKQILLQRNQLNALVGQYPNQPLALPESLAEFHLPDVLPLSLPAALVRNRPDIVAAGASLHAAAAQVGVAMAARLPQITLTADGGYVGSALAGLLSSPNQFWSLVGGMSQPIFDAGGLAHRQKAAEALYDQARAQYRSTVLNAFVNVADSLHALQEDSSARTLAAQTEQLAGQSWLAAQKQVELGAISPFDVLSVEQSYRQASLAVVQSEAVMYMDVAALYQALGGTW